MTMPLIDLFICNLFLHGSLNHLDMAKPEIKEYLTGFGVQEPAPKTQYIHCYWCHVELGYLNEQVANGPSHCIGCAKKYGEGKLICHYGHMALTKLRPDLRGRAINGLIRLNKQVRGDIDGE